MSNQDLCRKCREPIIWIQTEKGKNAPIDSNSKEVYVYPPESEIPETFSLKSMKMWVNVKDKGWQLRSVYHENVDDQGFKVNGHFSHFATCHKIHDFKKDNPNPTERWCSYDGRLRLVLLSVCQWHLDSQDPICLKCQEELRS